MIAVQDQGHDGGNRRGKRNLSYILGIISLVESMWSVKDKEKLRILSRFELTNGSDRANNS